MSRSGAELLIDTLVAHGVRQLFTLSGNQTLSIFDATIGRGITLIHTRHEAATAHMADAWGRLTEQPGVALVTAGPGHCNALSALYVARLAESPVVLLSGHCPRSEIGTGAFQEMDQVAAARPVAKAAWIAEDAGRLGQDIAAAFAIAGSGRPGPVHVSLPSDVLEAAVGDGPAPASREAAPGPMPVAETLVREVIVHLADARRPLILAGPAMGRGRRWAAVSRLAEVTGIPTLPMESPRGVNDPALHAAARCLSEADLVLLLGKRLDFSLRFGRPPAFSAGCRFVCIDVDADPVRPVERVALAVAGDPSLAAERLATVAREHTWRHGAWAREVAEARGALPAGWDELRRSPGLPIHPLRVCAAVQPFLDAGAAFVSDGGEFGQWAQAGLAATRRLINGPSGAIGSAVPMAIAAKLAHPERPVFVTLGDGTFGYHALEFDTALRYHLPIVAIVGNDARWNAEHQLQVQRYGAGRAVGCELLSSRYDKIVEALGGHGEFVQHPADLDGALGRAVASGLPACVNVLIEGAPAPTFQPA